MLNRILTKLFTSRWFRERILGEQFVAKDWRPRAADEPHTPEEGWPIRRWPLK